MGIHKGIDVSIVWTHGTTAFLRQCRRPWLSAHVEDRTERDQPGSAGTITASQWSLTLQATPTRKDVLARHLAKGRGHYQPGSCQANMELGLLRAACRWGLYQECWEGGDPTAGIKKWKRPNRKRTGKFEELRKLLAHFDDAQTEKEIRWRAIFGLMVFTGCRQNEARCAKVEAITPVPVTTYPLSAPPVTPPPVAVPSDDRRTMPLSGREREEWPW